MFAGLEAVQRWWMEPTSLGEWRRSNTEALRNLRPLVVAAASDGSSGDSTSLPAGRRLFLQANVEHMLILLLNAWLFVFMIYAPAIPRLDLCPPCRAARLSLRESKQFLPYFSQENTSEANMITYLPRYICEKGASRALSISNKFNLHYCTSKPCFQCACLIGGEILKKTQVKPT